MSVQVIKAFRQKPIVIYPVYLDITGDYATSAALAQVLYWHETMGGKFYKVDSDFERELHLTSKQFKRVKTALKALSFLKITLEQVPAKTFYDVDYQALSSLIASVIEPGKGQTRLSQKGQTVQSQKGQTESSQKVRTITENTKTEITQNNSIVSEALVNPVKSVNDLVLLSLLSLDENQKLEASKKLAALSPVQRDLAVKIFNDTVSAGRVKSSPMALLNQLVNLGLKNALELPKVAESVQYITPSLKTPPVDLKAVQDGRLEVIKGIVSVKKSDLLKEFLEHGFVTTKSLGIVIEPDLRLAGLFD